MVGDAATELTQDHHFLLFTVLFFKVLLFLERRGGREKGRERNTDM